jgi:hypothetical protein
MLSLTEPQRNLVLGALVGVGSNMPNGRRWKRRLRKQFEAAIKILDPAVVKVTVSDRCVRRSYR